MSKVLIAMSGGVDSSVAAALLKDQGYTCLGSTIRLFENSDIGQDNDNSCCSLTDTEYARSVAASMGMPYYVFNQVDRFRQTVIKDFIDNYACGRTPNPCIICNRELKFGVLYERAMLLGCDHIATGHYARVSFDAETGRFLLKKAVDKAKDQSYVLYFLTQEQLSHTLFPLGELTKPEVRAIAAEKGFHNAQKPDSQDICFVPDGNYTDFICRNTQKTFEDGDFVDSDGNVLGRHHGIINYTVGQRKGLGISAEAPLYVKRIDRDNNTVILGRANEMFSKTCRVENVNWISGLVPEAPVQCKVRIRYHHPEQPATVTALSDNEAEVTFDEPVRAITPGQAAVFYDGETVLGGGTISFSGD
ncbi:MAG: tRNA 2-thiouridine(34) synthase MnmA [Clostridia bacterium]|nr:tRNA 2-thiouridine(34) synthase MnmA [Clostridia bacterium]